MPLEGADFLACLEIPEFDSLVITARSQCLDYGRSRFINSPSLSWDATYSHSI
jgi:hypothetical protein